MAWCGVARDSPRAVSMPIVCHIVPVVAIVAVVAVVAVTPTVLVVSVVPFMPVVSVVLVVPVARCTVTPRTTLHITTTMRSKKRALCVVICSARGGVCVVTGVLYTCRVQTFY